MRKGDGGRYQDDSGRHFKPAVIRYCVGTADLVYLHPDSAW